MIPVWSMQYRGGFIPEYWKHAEALAVFLTKALMVLPQDFPIRGPQHFALDHFTFEGTAYDGQFIYRNSWTGDLTRFKGEESIDWNGVQVYYHDYIGGINRNKHFPVVVQS